MRVRLTEIDNADLSVFEFDYDLTFMVFFLSPSGKVYARYGGRDAEGPDNRQSLAGLRYTMKSVLAMHERVKKSFPPQARQAPISIRKLAGALGTGRCFHCHQVKEVLIADLQGKKQWSQDMYWTYPMPENIGLTLEVDRGNAVKEVIKDSRAARAGLKPGDVLTRLNGVPAHSFGDVQYALDKAASAREIEAAWRRGSKTFSARLALPNGWRRTDISWRPSLRYLIPSVRLAGTDLTAEEKKALGLSPRHLAFRQRNPVSPQARSAGIRPGDVILGIEDKSFEMGVEDFLLHVPRFYLIGDRVKVNLLRDGKALTLPMAFVR